MQSYSDLLMLRLHERAKAGSAVNIKTWYHWTLFDLFGDLCYGESFGCLRDSKSHPWIDIIGESIQAFYYIGLARRIPGLQKLMFKMMPKKKIEQAAWHSKFSSDLADKRMAMVTDRPDFMSYILKYNDEKGLSVPEIRSNSNVLIPGGSETTGTFLTGTTWHLLKNPKVYNTLVEEIRSNFTTSEEITITKLLQLKYLNGVIEEGLRIYPPVPSNMPRVIPEDGAMICGKWLPGGVGYLPFTHPGFVANGAFPPRRPLQWRHTQCFKTHPISKTQSISIRSVGSEILSLRRMTELHFSRSRLAQEIASERGMSLRSNKKDVKLNDNSLAYAEMRLVLAKMLWNFDLELMPESENWFPHEMVVIWNSPDLHIKLHAVER